MQHGALLQQLNISNLTCAQHVPLHPTVGVGARASAAAAEAFCIPSNRGGLPGGLRRGSREFQQGSGGGAAGEPRRQPNQAHLAQQPSQAQQQQQHSDMVLRRTSLDNSALERVEGCALFIIFL